MISETENEQGGYQPAHFFMKVPGKQEVELTGRSTKPGWVVTLVDWVPRVTEQINRTDVNESDHRRKPHPKEPTHGLFDPL